MIGINAGGLQSSGGTIKSGIESLMTDIGSKAVSSYTLEISGSNLSSTATMIDGSTITVSGDSLSHTHTPSFSFSGGVVTLTIGEANFNSAASNTATFDVASTRWYDDKIQSAKVEASNAALSGVYLGFSDGKAIAYSEGGTALCSESYPSSSPSVTLSNGSTSFTIASGYTIPSSATGYTITF